MAVQVSTLPYRPTVQVPNTTGSVMDRGSVYTGLLGAISGYIYRTGKLWALAGWLSVWLDCWFDRHGTHVWGGGWGAGDEFRVSQSARCGLASRYKAIFCPQIETGPFLSMSMSVYKCVIHLSIRFSSTFVYDGSYTHSYLHVTPCIYSI